MSKEVDLTKIFKRNIKTLAIIYCLLLIVFLLGSYAAGKLPKPYHKRDIPSEITPWLK